VKNLAEYISNQIQTVALNNAIELFDSIPCNKGCVYHENGSGNFILKGKTPNCFARYQVVFNGNVSIPTGGEVTPIALALSVNGETRNSSLAIFTPTAVEEFGNVTSTAIITVPRGCCFNLSVRYVDATALDPAVTPTPSIEVANANLTITRIA
jgi:hypothetical protein